MKKYFPFYIATIIFFVIIRITFNDSPKQSIIVTGINLLALFVVVISLTEQIKERVYLKLSQSGNPPEIVNREIKRHSFWIRIVPYSIYIIFAILFYVFLNSELANSILSIVSLGIAICDTYFADLISSIIKL